MNQKIKEEVVPFEPYEMLKKDQMTRAAHRKKLCKPLNKTQ